MTSLAVLIGRGLLSVRPAAGTPGSIYYATDTATLYRDNGSSWDSIEGAGGLANPMTTAGDIITGGVSGAPQRLAVASDGDVLTLVSGAPAWAAAGGGGGYTQGVRAYHSADQSLASGSLTTLAFDSEYYDTDTIHDTVTDNSRLTCKTAGVYLVVAHVNFADAVGGAGYRQLAIRLNGATYIGNAQYFQSGNTGMNIGVATIAQLVVNDYIELQAAQTQGASLAVKANAQWSPEFMMQRIG